jgi:hypothetical protein
VPLAARAALSAAPHIQHGRRSAARRRWAVAHAPPQQQLRPHGARRRRGAERHGRTARHAPLARLSPRRTDGPLRLGREQHEAGAADRGRGAGSQAWCCGCHGGAMGRRSRQWQRRRTSTCCLVRCALLTAGWRRAKSLNARPGIWSCVFSHSIRVAERRSRSRRTLNNDTAAPTDAQRLAQRPARLALPDFLTHARRCRRVRRAELGIKCCDAYFCLFAWRRCGWPTAAAAVLAPGFVPACILGYACRRSCCCRALVGHVGA